MKYHIKLRKQKRGCSYPKEKYVDSKLDEFTVEYIKFCIDACIDFVSYRYSKNSYIKAWDTLINLLKTETDNDKALDETSKIMARARVGAC